MMEFHVRENEILSVMLVLYITPTHKTFENVIIVYAGYQNSYEAFQRILDYNDLSWFITAI